MPLGDLCEITVGRTPARNNPAFWGPGEPWVSIADMSQGLVITDTKEQITPAAAKAGKLVAAGTVMLSFKLSIGKVGIAGRDVYTNEAIAALPIRNRDQLLPEYLVRALQVADLAGVANRAAMGATLNKAKLQQFQIPLPPLDEQRRIAAILDQGDLLRDSRRRTLSKIGELSNSVFAAMFGDPAAPNGRFPLVQLAELIEPERPITYGILKPGPDTEGGVPYVRVADMKGGGIDLAGVRRTTPKIASEYRRSTLRSGDLLMSIRGHVGRFAFVPQELDGANITQDSARLALNDTVSSAYVRAAMEMPGIQQWMVRHTKGVAVRGINLGDLRKLPLPCPPLAKQQEFASTMKLVEVQRQAACIQLEHLDAIFAGLQARAFAGQL